MSRRGLSPPPMPAECFTLPRKGADRVLPALSGVRARTLCFLPVDDIMAASRIDEHWRSAAGSWEAWAAHFHGHPILSQCSEPFELNSPELCCATFNLGTAKFPQIEVLLSPSGRDKLLAGIGVVFGTPLAWFSLQVPLAHVMLRMRSFLDVGPPPPVFEGYAHYPPFVVVVAFVVRFFADNSQKELMISGLLSLYRWASSCTAPRFHKVMLSPALQLLHAHERGRLQGAQRRTVGEAEGRKPFRLPKHYLEELCELTVRATSCHWMRTQLGVDVLSHVKGGFWVDESHEAAARQQSSFFPGDGTSEVVNEILRLSAVGGRVDSKRAAAVETLFGKLPQQQQPTDPPPLRVFLPPDDDPRLVFGVWANIERAFPQMKDKVNSTVLDLFGRPGLDELLSAAHRIEYLRGIEAQFDEASKRTR